MKESDLENLEKILNNEIAYWGGLIVDFSSMKYSILSNEDSHREKTFIYHENVFVKKEIIGRYIDEDFVKFPTNIQIKYNNFLRNQKKKKFLSSC